MATPNISTIPGRIAWARSCAGLTANRLSVIAGLDRSHVRLIEGGGARTAAETVGKIAHVLKITTDWLITGEGAGPDPAALRALGEALRDRDDGDAADVPAPIDPARDSHPVAV